MVFIPSKWFYFPASLRPSGYSLSHTDLAQNNSPRATMMCVWCHSFRLVRPADGHKLSKLWHHYLTSDLSVTSNHQLAAAGCDCADSFHDLFRNIRIRFIAKLTFHITINMVWCIDASDQHAHRKGRISQSCTLGIRESHRASDWATWPTMEEGRHSFQQLLAGPTLTHHVFILLSVNMLNYYF